MASTPRSATSRRSTTSASPPWSPTSAPLKQPATKQQLLANADLIPPSLLSHPVGIAQWESASTSASPETGWGGRMADLLKIYSGSLPPVLDAGPSSIFTVGQTVQAVSVQANTGSLAAIPGEVESAILAIANAESTSVNQITAAAAKIRVAAAQQGVILAQAQSAGGGIATAFPASGFGNALKAVAEVIKGRSVIGASRQIFYCMQGSYDSHINQLQQQGDNLTDLDAGLGAFMAAMAEIGLQNQVLVCTHSDFSRSMQANSTGGTDHAWGNHQLLLGGGIGGGKIYGSMPDFDLGGSSDLTNQGIWIPSTSVTQMTAGIGSWMGLNATQLSTVFPRSPQLHRRQPQVRLDVPRKPLARVPRGAGQISSPSLPPKPRHATALCYSGSTQCRPGLHTGPAHRRPTEGPSLHP